MLQAAGPLLVALLLGFVIVDSRRTGESEPDRAATTTVAATDSQTPSTAAASDLSLVDFSALRPGDTVPEWNTSQGNFRIVSRDGRPALELSHEPMVEGRLVWNRIFKSHGLIRSRMQGERTRRSAPRFALGVAGSTATYWFRAIPSEKALQFVAQEQTLQSVPWTWDEEKPIWLELRVLPAPETNGASGDAGSILEGRVWSEGETRPESPTLVHPIAHDLGFARALVAAAPYALKPVYLDHLEVESP
ncbi:MAG: hypothetical protein GXX91_12115 [Verrucomicrobiaceae bacterium]|nr:hypothetical protein [Verrucomicrobiaceae bacterium]